MRPIKSDFCAIMNNISTEFNSTINQNINLVITQSTITIVLISLYYYYFLLLLILLIFLLSLFFYYYTLLMIKNMHLHKKYTFASNN